MCLRHAFRTVLVIVLVGAFTHSASAYVEERYTLPRIVNESTHIMVVRVEKVNKERKLIFYKKVADLKGTHPADAIKHNVGVGGFNANEQRIPIEWADPGKLAIFFHNGAASETCIGKYWYQAYAGGEWWNHSHGEPYLCRTYSGDVEGLRDAVEKLLKGQEIVVPCTVSKTDLRIQKVRATMKTPLEYVVVEPPTIEKTKLANVAGFSEMLDLPLPPGTTQGGIAVDFDNDGFTDLLLVGSHGLRLLRNNRKGNFEDVTDRWGLTAAPGCLSAAFADYNKSGRLSLLTSAGKLYTNLGDKFRDDSALLPATPKRVTNPGEALAWMDVNQDGLPDIICSVGLRGLAAFINKGGADKKWFADESDKAGLGENGLGQAAANFLTTLDLNQDQRPDFILNLASPLVALNHKGVFQAAADTGISYPALSRPAVAFADYQNDGRLGLFVTANNRQGALTDWNMIGTFSAGEDKALAAGPDFSPETKPAVTLGKESWNWQHIRAQPNGTMAVGRGQPSPNSSYAFTTFDWPQDEKVAFYIGSENGLSAWLNGKQIYDFKGKRPYVADTDKLEVDVLKGPNKLLLKVFDEGPRWRTCVRILHSHLYPLPAVQLYVSDGPGKFTDVVLKSGDLAQLRADCVSAVWADIDNDGLLDLLVTDKSGLVRVYRNQGEGVFRYITAELGLEQKFKAVGLVTADFDNDGSLDLVLLGADPNPCVALFSKIKGKPTPLTVRFAGPDSALGAVVGVTDDKGRRLGTRFIAGGDGRNMQSTPEARFALAPGKYRIDVRYSSGQVRAKTVEIAGKPVWETIDQKTPAAGE